MKISAIVSKTLGLFVALIVTASVCLYASASYITGTVTSSSGKPAPSLWVEVVKGDEVLGRSLTGDDGRYHIGGLDAGTYKILVKRNASVLFHDEVTLPKEQAYDVRLP